MHSQEEEAIIEERKRKERAAKEFNAQRMRELAMHVHRIPSSTFCRRCSTGLAENKSMINLRDTSVMLLIFGLSYFSFLNGEVQNTLSVIFFILFSTLLIFCSFILFFSPTLHYFFLYPLLFLCTTPLSHLHPTISAKLAPPPLPSPTSVSVSVQPIFPRAIPSLVFPSKNPARKNPHLPLRRRWMKKMLCRRWHDRLWSQKRKRLHHHGGR